LASVDPASKTKIATIRILFSSWQVAMFHPGALRERMFTVGVLLGQSMRPEK
jgi:hypothetical protein